MLHTALLALSIHTPPLLSPRRQDEGEPRPRTETTRSASTWDVHAWRLPSGRLHARRPRWRIPWAFASVSAASLALALAQPSPPLAMPILAQAGVAKGERGIIPVGKSVGQTFLVWRKAAWMGVGLHD